MSAFAQPNSETSCNNAVECVGSLVVGTKDLEELSSYFTKLYGQQRAMLRRRATEPCQMPLVTPHEDLPHSTFSHTTRSLTRHLTRHLTESLPKQKAVLQRETAATPVLKPTLLMDAGDPQTRSWIASSFQKWHSEE